jgi:hypothetical protein
MPLMTFLNNRPPTRGLVWLALSDQASLLTLTSVDDQGGGVTRTWTAGGNVPCRIDPLTNRGGVTGGMIDERSTHIVTTSADTSVDVSDRLAISGRGTFEVTAVRERTGQLTQVFEVLSLQ